MKIDIKCTNFLISYCKITGNCAVILFIDNVMKLINLYGINIKYENDTCYLEYDDELIMEFIGDDIRDDKFFIYEDFKFTIYSDNVSVHCTEHCLYNQYLNYYCSIILQNNQFEFDNLYMRSNENPIELCLYDDNIITLHEDVTPNKCNECGNRCITITWV